MDAWQMLLSASYMLVGLAIIKDEKLSAPVAFMTVLFWYPMIVIFAVMYILI